MIKQYFVGGLLCCAEFTGGFLLDMLCGGWIYFVLKLDFIEVSSVAEKADSQIGDCYIMDGGRCWMNLKSRSKCPFVLS